MIHGIYTWKDLFGCILRIIREPVGESKKEKALDWEQIDAKEKFCIILAIKLVLLSML